MEDMYKSLYEGAKIDLAHGVVDSLTPLQRYCLNLALEDQENVEYFRGILSIKIQKDQRGE